MSRSISRRLVYLWPVLITTRDDMQTIQIGIRKMMTTNDALTEWPIVMATAVLVLRSSNVKECLAEAASRRSLPELLPL